MSDPRILNIEAYHVECRATDTGFVIEFHGATINDVKHIVKIKFDGLWFITYIAEAIKIMLRKKRDDLDRAEKAMGIAP